MAYRGSSGIHFSLTLYKLISLIIEKQIIITSAFAYTICTIGEGSTLLYTLFQILKSTLVSPVLITTPSTFLEIYVFSGNFLST